MSKAKTREPGKIVGGSNRNLALPGGLDSLSDVTVATPTDGQVLQYVNANRQWEPTVLPSPIKSYVDGHVQTLTKGTLRHAIEEIISTPPVTPKGLYIVGKNATGEWAGHQGKIAIENPLAAMTPGAEKWFFMEPHNNEERLVKSENGVFQYVATTKEWVEIAVGGPSNLWQPAQVLSSKFKTGDLGGEMFHNVTVKTKVGYVYIMDFGGTFHASHNNSIGYYSFNIDGGERAKYKVAGGNGYAQGGSYKYFIDGTGNDVNFAFMNTWTASVVWEFCWCMLTEIYRKP